MAKWTFTISGKTFTSTKGIDDLYKQVKATYPHLTKKLIEKKTIRKFDQLYIKDTDTHEVFKVDKKIQPALLKREFGLTRNQSEKTARLIKDNKTGSIKEGLRIVNKINDTDVIEAVMRVTIVIDISEDIGEYRYQSGVIDMVDVKPDKKYLEKKAREIAQGYINSFIKTVDRWHIDSYELIGSRTGLKFEMKNMRLRANDFLTIFNKSIRMFKPKEGQNCVRAYLKKILKKISVKTLNNLGNDDGVTPDDIKQFCEKYRIKYRCYSREGNIISSHTPEIRNKNYKAIIIMAYNNHIYPIKNKYLNNDMVDYKKPVIINDSLNEKLNELLNEGKHPVNIKLKKEHSEILYIETEDKVYLDNPDYENLKSLCYKLGIEDKIPYDINVVNVSDIIMPLYIKNKNSVKSFMPDSTRFIKGGYNYSKYKNVENEGDIEEDDIITMDKNKCYSYTLANLQYLIKVDYRTAKIIKPVTQIIEHYLYICKPNVSTILMPTTNIYTGKTLIECNKWGIAYEIIEGIETEIVNNYFSAMVHDIFYNCDSTMAKNICNRLFGKMNVSKERFKGISTKFEKIANNDELDRSNTFSERINDKYHMCFRLESYEMSDIYNMKPIYIQIIDGAREILFNKIKDIGLKDDEIIQIKTDSITFDNSRVNYVVKDEPNNFDGWKLEEFKPIDAYDIDDLCMSTTFEHKIYVEGQKTELITGNAGNGKTYHILNDIIPNLKGSTIVLTPSHASLKTYKSNGINCNVIQKYVYNTEIPDVDNIIVDEIGMCDKGAFEVLIRSAYLGRNIICLGDFTQLLPPSSEGKQIDNELFFNCLFRKQTILKGNKRNHFSEEYYNELRESENKEYLINEVHKHSVKWKDAEYIICYRNDTVNKMNEKKLKYLGLEKDSIGARIICKTNDLREKGIYNKFMFNIIKHVDDGYILDDGTFITKDEFDDNFVSGYAVTLYCIQGSSINSYCYAKDDNYFIDGRSAYTTISRLKTIEYKEEPKKEIKKKESKKKEVITLDW